MAAIGAIIDPVERLFFVLEFTLVCPCVSRLLVSRRPWDTAKV